MGVTRCNLVFSALQVLFSHLWEKEKGGGRREGEKKGIEKESRKEEGIKKERNTESKKEVMWKGGKKERKEKRRKKSYPGFKLVRLVLLVFLCVKWEVVFGGIGFTFLPS